MGSTHGSGAAGPVPGAAQTSDPDRGRCVTMVIPLPVQVVAPSTVRSRSRAAGSRPRRPGRRRRVDLRAFLPRSAQYALRAHRSQSFVDQANRDAARRVISTWFAHFCPSAAARSSANARALSAAGPSPPDSETRQPDHDLDRVFIAGQLDEPGQVTATAPRPSRPESRSARPGRSAPPRSGRRRHRRRAGHAGAHRLGRLRRCLGQQLVTRSATARSTSCERRWGLPGHRCRRPAPRRPCRRHCRRGSTPRRGRGLRLPEPPARARCR